MNVTEQHTFNFDSEENVAKWKKVFVAALGKKLLEVHPKLTITPDALEKIEKLLVRMLKTLCTPTPFLPHHTVADVLKRVNKKFLEPIKSWAIADANAAIDKFQKTKKATCVTMPVDKIHQLLVKEIFNCKIDYQVSLFISAVLEYIAGDMLKLIGNYVKNIKHSEITHADIDIAMCADKVLMAMLFEDDEEEEERMIDTERNINQGYHYHHHYRHHHHYYHHHYRHHYRHHYHNYRLRYRNCYRHQQHHYRQHYHRHHHRCHRHHHRLHHHHHHHRLHHHRLHHRRLHHHHHHHRLHHRRLHHHHHRRRHHRLHHRRHHLLHHRHHHQMSDMDKRMASCRLFRRKGMFVMMMMIMMMGMAVMMMMGMMMKGMMMMTGMAVTMKMMLAMMKMDEIQLSIDGWVGRNLYQICNGYITEGYLQKVSGKRVSDRYVFLLDGLVILTKRIASQVRRSVTAAFSGSYEYKLKEKFMIRKIDVIDRDDTDELKNAFEIVSSQHKQQSTVVLIAKSLDEKINWLSVFFSLIYRSTLERWLDTKLKEEEKKQPLKMPTPDVYRLFAEEDSEDNILFEDNGYDNGNSNDIPIIKGGTILKLVERLTYHSYFDPKFIKTFLTTYRTTANQPEKQPTCQSNQSTSQPISQPTNQSIALQPPTHPTNKPHIYTRTHNIHTHTTVLNVIRLWVDYHWYDFENNKPLQSQVKDFVNESLRGRGKLLIKWVETILKIMNRKFSMIPNEPKQITFSRKPPMAEWHISKIPTDYDLMNLHPIEIARQVTLLEFEIFQKIKSSEMVGAVWMKKEKHLTSPNLLKMIHHTTKFTFWLEKCIVEAENFEERVAVVCRVLELLIVFQELNNFNGVVEVYSALNSASVHRLDHTFEKKYPKHQRAYEEAKELNGDHFKRYLERLRSINPPCIPFLGMYLTNIFQLEEGNPDYLPNRPPEFINFSKRRKVYEITAEIQQYQDQPYCLNVEPTIKAFIENLRPLGDMSEKDFDDYLYERSLVIEPRNGKPAKLERKRPYSLKSPGTKPTS
ncbi:hypothetical protein HELRODRAFT_84957, partial [Helobdella robusta]|uniref:Ras-GEF domain-containing protein n=1 Tax=Helobdella robusta TaxID=6412 RepID=T1G5Q9_HELRO